MSIRKKSILAVFVVLIVAAVSLYTVVYQILIDGFHQLELREAKENIARLRAVFTDQYAELTMKARDWGLWDDAMQFVVKPDPEFIRANFTDSNFPASRLHLMAYIDLQGNLVYGREFDFGTMRQIPVSPAVQQFFRMEKVFRHPDHLTTSQGFLLLPEGPFILASVPVTDTNGGKPHVGSVVFGRRFDQGEQRRLQVKTGLTVLFATAAAASGDPRWRPLTGAAGADTAVSAESDDTLGAFGRLEDLNGQPVLLFRLELSRRIHREAVKSLRLVLLVITLALLVFALLIHLLIDRLVVRRITAINRDLQYIVDRRAYDTQLPFRGRDEISGLTESINGLLAAESTIIAASPGKEGGV